MEQARLSSPQSLRVVNVMQMTLSLLEGNLMPAHMLADGVCLGLAALMLPPLWIFSGLLSAAVFVATVSCFAWSVLPSAKGERSSGLIKA